MTGSEEPDTDRKEDPAADERAPEAAAAPTPDAADDVPLSEDDALRALRKGSVEDDDVEAAQVASIAEAVAQRLQRDPSSPRIDTLAMFTGTVSVAGGMAVGTGAATRPIDRPTRIDGAIYADFVDSYCLPEGFAEARERLAKGRVVILALPPGTGREAAGVNLGAEVVATYVADGAGDLYRIPDTQDLADTSWRPPTSSSGYIVVLDDERADPTGETIDEHWISTMSAVLTEHDSFLVVVTGPPRGKLVSSAVRCDHVITFLGTVDPRAIIDRRVLGADPGLADLAELRDRLTAAGGLQLIEHVRAPHVAARLADVIKAGGDLAAEVRRLRDPEGQVHRWFSRHQDLGARCFTLAAAVLEDAGYLIVSDAAMELHAMLCADTPSSPDLRFRESLDSGHLLLEISVPPRKDHDGALPPLPRVRFRDPLVQQAVLGYGWTYLDGFRSVILKWLRRLIIHPDVEVRARTSVTAGVLAWTDFNHALHRFLRSWAGGAEKAVRHAAAAALSVAGAHAALTDSVWRLLEMWAAEGGTPVARRRSLTAAAAMASGMARQQPERAMSLLRRVLDRDDWGTLRTTGVSVAYLIENGCVAEVLSALRDWSEPQDSSPLVTKALSVFVFAASQPISSADETGVRPPGLLTRSREFHANLVELWARALARKPAQTQALEAIREILDGYAKRDHLVLGNMRAILLGVAAEPGRHRERLAFYLRQWAEDRRRPSGTAAEILSVLPGSD